MLVVKEKRDISSFSSN